MLKAREAGRFGPSGRSCEADRGSGGLQCDLARAETHASGEAASGRSAPRTRDRWFAALFGAQVRGQSGLYEKRISYLGQEIDDLVINQIVSVMLFADAEVRVRARVRARVANPNPWWCQGHVADPNPSPSPSRNPNPNPDPDPDPDPNRNRNRNRSRNRNPDPIPSPTPSQVLHLFHLPARASGGRAAGTMREEGCCRLGLGSGCSHLRAP